jgi:hypothetical protein
LLLFNFSSFIQVFIHQVLIGWICALEDMSELFRIGDVPTENWTGIIEQSNGAVVQVSGKLNSWKLKQIYNIIKSATTALFEETIRKITISFESHQYIILFDDAFIYVLLQDS